MSENKTETTETPDHADAIPSKSEAVDGPREMPRLMKQYLETVAPSLAGEFGLKNPMQRPKLSAIVVNVNMGRHLDGTKIKSDVKATVLDTLTVISGQKPVVIKAKKSVANFKVREGYETAAKVTLRRDRMWHFLDRLINLAAPRIKDFQGFSRTSFDQAGNYSIGLNEQGVFPEVDLTKTNVTHGMHINLVFKRSSPDVSRYVLEQLGLPFTKIVEKKKKGAA